MVCWEKIPTYKEKMKKIFMLSLLIPFNMLAQCPNCEQIDEIIFEYYYKYNEDGELFSDAPFDFIDLKSDRERAIFYSGCVFSINDLIKHRESTNKQSN